MAATSSSDSAPTTMVAATRALRALLPAILATALLVWVDAAVRALTAAAPGHVLASLIVLPLYQIALFVLPPALVAAALVVIVAMTRPAPGPIPASLMFAASMVAYLAAVAWSSGSGLGLAGLGFWALIASAGALAAIMWSRPWPRVRRVVVILAIFAVALIALGFAA